MAKSGKRNICGPRVRRFRVALGLSQPALAAKCQRSGWDVSRDIIARIEGQTRWVADSELVQLATVLNVELRALVSDEGR